MNFLNVWITFISLTIVCSSCESNNDQKQLNRSATAMRNCAKELELSAQEEARIREEIKADQKAQRIKEIARAKFRAGLNGSILVAQKGVILYKGWNGLGHIEKHLRDTIVEDSKFQLASLSKTFTAVATLKLVEAGKLSFEDTIQKFYPDFPYHNITIHDLLSHRSGLPNYAYAFDDSMKINFYKRDKPYPTNATIMHWFATVKPTPKRYNIPGRTFSYSNTNYMVLASIIEKVANQPFETFVQKNIFEPLGMNNSYLATSKSESFTVNKTAGYQGNRRIPKDYYDDVLGDKGVYSTVGDLFKWYMALNGDCLLRKKTLAEAFIPRSFEKKSIKNYGYGFRMRLDANEQPEYIYHTGWWKGYNAMFWFSPRHEYVVIMLSNRLNRLVFDVQGIANVLESTNKSIGPEEDGEVEL
ncbi:serine hydrolase domain-containing protein [Nibrella saemangeumensis]|uniref:Serine hydrolase domain-containing protein n=1 Tax=Nibrella saemangeumensis TaxID=1084526 RepID=A0ABP8NFP4_9BACT